MQVDRTIPHITSYILDLDIFGITVYIVCSEDSKGREREYLNQVFKDSGVISEDMNWLIGKSIQNVAQQKHIIWLRDYNLSTLAHEVCHFCHDRTEVLGIDDNETEAYITSYIVGQWCAYAKKDIIKHLKLLHT